MAPEYLRLVRRGGTRDARSHHGLKHLALAALLGLCAAAGLDLLILAYQDLEDVLGAPKLDRLESVDAAAPAPPADARFAGLAALETFTPMAGGNGVELLTTGAATFPRLWADLHGARRTIAVEQYYCGKGQVADSLAAALAERARAGVRVLFLWDGFGCKSLGVDYFAALRQAGAAALPFRPVHWYSLHRGQHRTHLRAVIIDGRIGYIGGAGFDDKWLTGSDGDPPWRDTNARFTGPAVATLQAAFATGWAEASGRLLVGDGFFPDSDTARPPAVDPAPAGAPGTAGATSPAGALAGILFSPPTVGPTAAERLLALTTEAARRRLWITNPYFLPSQGLRAVLAHAARRGVDVRVLTAGDRIDVPILRQAARSYYGELLRAGVRIYEYQPAMIHAKTLVVDDAWSTVGTLNFDARSLRLNAEATLLVQDPATAAALDAIFLADLARSREIRLPELERRSAVAKLWERICRLFAPFL